MCTGVLVVCGCVCVFNAAGPVFALDFDPSNLYLLSGQSCARTLHVPMRWMSLTWLVVWIGVRGTVECQNENRVGRRDHKTVGLGHCMLHCSFPFVAKWLCVTAPHMPGVCYLGQTVYRGHRAPIWDVRFSMHGCVCRAVVYIMLLSWLCGCRGVSLGARDDSYADG